MVFKIFALIFLYCCIPRPLELNMLAKYTCFELVSFCVGYLKKKRRKKGNLILSNLFLWNKGNSEKEPVS